MGLPFAGLPCLNVPCPFAGALFAGDGLALVLEDKSPRATSKPSAVLNVTFGLGAKAEELAFNREVFVEGVGGGEDIEPILADGWARGGGGCGEWTGLAAAWDSVGVPDPG